MLCLMGEQDRYNNVQHIQELFSKGYEEECVRLLHTSW